MRDQHRFNLKAWLLWTAGFLAFPIGGFLAEMLTGRAIGVGVDSQLYVFGASGAITFMALSGVLLDRLRAATSPAAPAPQPTGPPTAIVQ
ncbi:MAG TPA: hypothetical protein VK942_07650 [Actinomycetes bacterium]|nr:hypothetical protein [Actinomycetes bacterium]